MLKSQSKIFFNSLIFSSGAFIDAFLCLILDALRIYLGIGTDFVQNDNPLSQCRLLNK